jgi:hypothetical protein
MPRRHGKALLLLLGIALFAPHGTARAEGVVWPLQEGTYWVYEGRVKWGVLPSNRIHTERVRWKTRVKRTVSGPQAHLHLVEGFPADLASYRPKMTSEPSVIVKRGNTFFLLHYYGRPNEATAFLSDPDMALSRLRPEDTILRFPLRKGDFFGQSPGRSRRDGFYRWNVEQRLVRTLKVVKGIKDEGRRETFVITYRTWSDYQLIEFAPGIGIVHYQYHHFGTVNDVDVRLVEYHRGP